MTAIIFRPAPETVARIMGAGHYVVVANGTSALAGLISCLARSDLCCLPSIACRSLTQACIWAGATPWFLDVNPVSLASDDPMNSELRLRVNPWFCSEDHDYQVGTIDDLSINLSPTVAKRWVSLASLGPGKPGYWPYRGAIIATDSADVMERFSDIVTMSSQRRSWSVLTPRVTLVEVSDASVEQHFQWVSVIQAIREDQASRLVEWMAKHDEVLTPLGRARGNSVLLPVLVPETADVEDLAEQALQNNIPLGTQPVKPAYLEPVLKQTPYRVSPGGTPNAIELSRRLMFVPVKAADDQGALDRLLDLVLGAGA